MPTNHLYASLKVIISSALVFTLLLLGTSEPTESFSQHIIYTPSSSSYSNKIRVVILTFGDGLKNQYTNATPILSDYGFNASYFITCNFVGLKSRMNWHEIVSLYQQGNDIGTKTISYKILNHLSSPELDFEVGQSKMCLQNHATPRGLE